MIGKWKSLTLSNHKFQNNAFREEFIIKSNSTGSPPGDIDSKISELFNDFETSNCDKFGEDLKIINEAIDDYESDYIQVISNFDFVNLLSKAYYEFLENDSVEEEILFCIGVLVKCDCYCDFFFPKWLF